MAELSNAELIAKTKQALVALNFQAPNVTEHKAVMTAAEHKEVAGHLQGLLTRNLLLKSKKKELVLVTSAGHREVDLKALAHKLGGGGYRFAGADVLLDALGVKEGCVTPLAIMNDKHHQVKVVLDSELISSGVPVLVHPLTNTATIGISGADLLAFIAHYAKEPATVVDFVQLSAGSTPAAADKKTDKASKPKAKETQGKKTETKAADDDEKQTLLGIQAKKSTDFADWYQEVLKKSEMIDYYDISGCYILRPWSYAMWELIQQFLDSKIKSLGVKNMYFPLFVSEASLQKEKDHLEGFAPEVAWVTKAGKNPLAVPIAIRPTSETIMYPYFANWIRSHRDLPLRINQWCNVVRWEFSNPTPFIRSREFLWQEGHTAHATKEDAGVEVLQVLDIYAQTYENMLCVPVIKGKKTEKEKFAGGDYTTTVEGFIPATGRGVQGATSHCLGQNFSHMFDIQFEDEHGQRKFAWQNSWGFTTRSIGVMVMLHSDDKGLVLPPPVAPVQVVLVPIYFKKNGIDALNAKLDEINQSLSSVGIRVESDKRTNVNPGFKFNDWELRGVPLRIELGPKDMDNKRVKVVRRDTGASTEVAWSDLTATIPCMLSTMKDEMLARARSEVEKRVVKSLNWTEFMNALNNKCMALAPWCGVKECETNIKGKSAEEDEKEEDETRKKGAAKSLCIPFSQPEMPADTGCVCCSQPAKMWVLFGRSY